MKKLLLVIGFVTFSTFLSAQQAFDGFNFQVGIGGTQSQVNASGTEDTSWSDFNPKPNPSIDGISSATRLNGIASIGYSQSFDNVFRGFNLAANVFYVIGEQSGGNKSSTAIVPGETQTISGSYKVKNTWGISLEPGYYISKDLLGYLKFAYVSSSATVSAECYSSLSYCYGPNGRNMNESTTINKSINGIGYGFGGKYQIT